MWWHGICGEPFHHGLIGISLSECSLFFPFWGIRRLVCASFFSDFHRNLSFYADLVENWLVVGLSQRPFCPLERRLQSFQAVNELKNSWLLSQVLPARSMNQLRNNSHM